MAKRIPSGKECINRLSKYKDHKAIMKGLRANLKSIEGGYENPVYYWVKEIEVHAEGLMSLAKDCVKVLKAHKNL